MPELPEVETIVRALREPLIGQTIVRVRNYWPRHIATPSPDELQRRIHNCRIEHVLRRGKYLVFALSREENLIIHLKMTGQLACVPSGELQGDHVHTVFELANGYELRFRDVRKFGRIYLVRDTADVLGNLGPEPLSESFSARHLHEGLKSRRRVLKPLLLDQTFLAGVGNIYADEALFYAGIRPMRRTETLTEAHSQDLYQSIRKALELGIAGEGATISDYRKPDGSKGGMQTRFAVYGRAGEPCLRCGTSIERIILGGRSTHYCPDCQS